MSTQKPSHFQCVFHKNEATFQGRIDIRLFQLQPRKSKHLRSFSVLRSFVMRESEVPKTQEAPLGQTERGFFICCYRYSTLHLLHESAQTILEALQLVPIAVRLRVCHKALEAVYLLDVVVSLRHCHWSLQSFAAQFIGFLSSRKSIMFMVMIPSWFGTNTSSIVSRYFG